jgi:hypothetical protein
VAIIISGVLLPLAFGYHAGGNAYRDAYAKATVCRSGSCGGADRCLRFSGFVFLEKIRSFIMFLLTHLIRLLRHPAGLPPTIISLLDTLKERQQKVYRTKVPAR